MNSLSRNSVRVIGVSVGALLLSTLGIMASDELAGVSSRLSGTVFEARSVCGTHAELIAFGSHSICMDVYEASPSSACVYQSPQSSVETIANTAKNGCSAVSEPAQEPWRFVTYTQASQLCAREGKRLPTAEEWYKVALGLPEVEQCFLNNTLLRTGEGACITPTGIHHIVGNVWEWMSDTVTNGQYKERSLPPSGYVSLVDETGIVLATSEAPEPAFGEDYATIDNEGVRGIIRGGFYGSGSDDGGIFTQNISAPLDFAAAGVGFRCVRDVW